MSGSRVLPSGVGTAIETASHSPSRFSSAVARNFPDFTKRATSSLGTSWMWDLPDFSRSTTRWLTSKPMTRNPARANSIASRGGASETGGDDADDGRAVGDLGEELLFH